MSFNGDQLKELLGDENEKKRIRSLRITGCSENDLMISGFANLVELKFDGQGKEDFKDVYSLTILNNPKLRTIVIRSGLCYSTTSLSLSSSLMYD